MTEKIFGESKFFIFPQCALMTFDFTKFRMTIVIDLICKPLPCTFDTKQVILSILNIWRLLINYEGVSDDGPAFTSQHHNHDLQGLNLT